MWAEYLLVCSLSLGCQAELAMRKTRMEVDVTVSPSPAPLSPPPELIFQLPNTREPAITLVHTERTES